MSLENARVLIAGMARSGSAAAQLCSAKGAHLLLYDKRPLSELPEETQTAVASLTYEDWMGSGEPDLSHVALVVTSPGLPPDLPLLKRAREAAVPVVSEIELGSRFLAGELVAVTGTNGKTTTTALTGEMFRCGGRNVHVLGNIGIPLTSKALETAQGDVAVVETAALQLDDIAGYHPDTSVILNITEDHLDRYGTMERYREAKARIFENQRSSDVCVLNADDPLTAGLADDVPCHTVLFSLNPLKDPNADAVVVKDGWICAQLGGSEFGILPASEVRIPGSHNLQNAMAASAAALSRGVLPDAIAEALRTFPGVEHRIEYVCEKDGVHYINDSKGTNPDATLKAIQAMTRPTVLILGGYDKHADFEPLIRSFGPGIRHIVLLGATAPKIARAAESCGWKSYETAASFEDAVYRAASAAVPGDTVLLSPACASWDMFSCFEERGKQFKEIVRSM